MKEYSLNSWSEFKVTIEDIRKTYGNNQLDKSKNTILFRGHQCANWSLQTTLERRTEEDYSLEKYLYKATIISPELNAYTGTKWEIPDYSELTKEIKENQDELFGPRLPLTDYLIYLRHHGYPSPLLDWSESPYIATYFAMFELSECNTTSDRRVAIYAYISTVDSIKSFAGGTPMIKVINPFITTHKRHFIQKAQYTVATKWLPESKEFIFCSHHDIFNNPNLYHPQDFLIKITIPVSERKSALTDLEDYNINHFTLFQTEDALVKQLSIKNFDLSDF